MGLNIRKLDIRALITAVYVCFVWLTYIFLNVTTEGIAILYYAVAILVGSYIIAHRIFQKLASIHFLKKEKTSKEIIFVYMLSSIITFAILMVWFIAYYPGSFSSDSIYQYEQALKGEYNDWHPVWQTFVFFTIPLKLTGSAVSIIIFQIIYFCLIVGFLAITIYEMFGFKIAIISCMYIWINPYVNFIMLYPWKDVGFALAGLLSLIICIRIIALKKKVSIWKIIFLGVLLASATIFRHNAIFFTLPMTLVLFFNLDKKIWLKILVCTVITFMVIKVPLYSFLGVHKPGSRISESMGLPLTIIGNVVKETPQYMDEELSEFVYSIATQEEWENNYETGNFNSIKFCGVDTSVVEKTGYFGMLRLMFKCFKLAPGPSIKALIALTDVVYGCENGMEGDVTAGIAENSYGIQYPQNRDYTMPKILESYNSLVNNTILKYFKSYGVILLVLLISTLSNLRFKSSDLWKRALIALPIFTYDFGTMLLLTGPDSRFFFITFLVTPIMILFPFYFREEQNNE